MTEIPTAVNYERMEFPDLRQAVESRYGEAERVRRQQGMEAARPSFREANTALVALCRKYPGRLRFFWHPDPRLYAIRCAGKGGFRTRCAVVIPEAALRRAEEWSDVYQLLRQHAQRRRGQPVQRFQARPAHPRRKARKQLRRRQAEPSLT